MTDEIRRLLHDRVHTILHEFQGTTHRTDNGWCDARDHADAIVALLSAEPPPTEAPDNWQLRLAFEAGFQWCANGTDKFGDYNGGSVEDGFRDWWQSRVTRAATEPR